ncbi:MAG: hypothetical protein AB7N53_03670 [Candidatus Binatia bacterium]
MVIAWPAPWAVAAAGLLIAVGLWLSSTAWLRVLGENDRVRRHRADYFSSQLGKYLPGGIWQPIGQVGLANERGVSALRSSAAFVAQAGLQVCAGAVLAVPLAFRPELPRIVRAAAALGVLAPLMLLCVIRLLRRWPMFTPLRLAIGTPRHALVTWVVLLVNLALQGAAFGLLASMSAPELLHTVAGYAAAWTIGFLAVPVPAGLGVREAMLVALLPGGPAMLVMVSVMARIMTMLTELVLIAVTRMRA